jgi:hypothetical protein
MAAPFFNRLEEYLSKISALLKGQSDAAAIFPNSADRGTTREQVYVNFLKQHLPLSCAVAQGGFIFDQTGKESKQIDAIVHSSSVPQYNMFNPDGTGKSFTCIDGCHAAISVKTSLDKEKLFDALDNIASIPDKSPADVKMSQLAGIPDFEDWPFKIIFAYDGIGFDTCTAHLREYYDSDFGKLIPENKRPNIIHVAGRYSYVRALQATPTMLQLNVSAGKFIGRESDKDIFPLVYTLTYIHRIVVMDARISHSFAELYSNAHQMMHDTTEGVVV